MRRVLAIVVALVCCLSCATAARAEFQGTPGKVAFIGTDPSAYPLKIWDPYSQQTTTIESYTVKPSTQNSAVIGFWSVPTWSPDGRFVAYSKEVPDTGDIPGLRHTAIFVYDAKNGTTRQVTFPDSGKKANTTPPPQDGHSVADWGPAWSPNGGVLYFIRDVEANKDDALYGERGHNVWQVPVAGGGAATQITHDTDPATVNWSVLAIPNTLNLVVAHQTMSSSELDIVSASSGTISRTIATSSVAAPITDYDVAPDGSAVTWTQFSGGFQLNTLNLNDGTQNALGATTSAYARFANDGSGVLTAGVSDRGQQGLIEQLLPDPEADIGPGETSRFSLAWTGFTGTTGAVGFPSRMAFDVQPQELPVIFIPGFLGSTLLCNGGTVWPVGVGNSAGALASMQLDASGTANAGCPDTAPDGSLVETVLGSPIYKTAADFFRNTFPSGRATLFGWDWRKRPQETLSRLDQQITTALHGVSGPWQDQGAERVVLVGHSYGGLLIRAYLKQHPERVARALTIGTPYWGSPKALFPLAFGIESPGFSPLDALLDNDALKQLSVNLAGLYQLYPSAAFGPWLNVDGTDQGAGAAVAGFVASIGGNAALLTQAEGYHDSVYEGFFDNSGLIDVRAVIGTGKPTVRAVLLTRNDDGTAHIAVQYGDGDATVPSRSAAQGPPGGGAPKGDPIHRQYVCGVDHVALPGDGALLAAYKDYMDFGAVPRRLPGPCTATGGVLEFDPGTLGVAPPPSTRRSVARAYAPPVVGLDDAKQQSLADVMRFARQTLVVTDTHTPLTLRLQITNGSFTWTPLSDDNAGTVYDFGPLTGTLEITPSADPSVLPVVTLDGSPVSGRPETPPSSGGSPGSGGAPASGGSPPPSGAAPGTTSTAAGRIRMVGRPRRAGRTVRVTLAVPGAGRLVLSAVKRRGSRTTTLGTLRRVVNAQGTLKLVVRCRHRVPHGATLAVRFTPSGGKPQRLSASVRS